MKKYLYKLGLLAFIIAPLTLFTPGLASATAPNWDVSGTWVARHEFGGNIYTHQNIIVQAPDGTLTGTGGWDGTQNGVPISTPNTWAMDSGFVSGDTIHFNYHYTSVETCALNGYVDAVIAVGGSMAGTWHDDCSGGRTGTWTTTAGVAVPLPSVITDPATSVTSTSAMVNGTNGAVNADNTSFWWGTTSSGPFTPSVSPADEFPSGWTHDGGLGSVSAGGSFSEPLTSLTPGIEYYFAAWSLVGSTWYPGAVLNFTTVAGPTPSAITNDATDITPTSATLNGTNGAVNADNTSFWWGTSSIGPLSAAADASSQFPSSGWSHDSGLGAALAGSSFNEPLIGFTSGTTYYFVAWSHVSGIWYPGAILSFITNTPTPTTGTISGTKYNDLNRNGKQDAGEPGLQGWVIKLLLDDPVTDKDTLITTATTDTSGNYIFSNIAPGTYDVRETHQKGWKRMSKNPKDIVISTGSVVEGVDFGNAVKQKRENEDSNKDDDRDEQHGHYFANHGRSNYERDHDKKDHEQRDENHDNNNPHH